MNERAFALFGGNAMIVIYRQRLPVILIGRTPGPNEKITGKERQKSRFEIILFRV